MGQLENVWELSDVARVGEGPWFEAEAGAEHSSTLKLEPEEAVAEEQVEEC